MEKLSAEKRAYYQGKAQTFRDLGFSSDAVKLAFIQEGVPALQADLLVKEAFGALLARGLAGAGKFLARGAGKLLRPAAQAGAKATMGQKAMGMVGRGMGNAGRGLIGGAKGVTQMGVPRALGHGAKNFGSGLLLGGGKGIGGTMGKGMFAAGTAAAFMPSGGSKPPQMPQQYGQY